MTNRRFNNPADTLFLNFAVRSTHDDPRVRSGLLIETHDIFIRHPYATEDIDVSIVHGRCDAAHGINCAGQLTPNSTP